MADPLRMLNATADHNRAGAILRARFWTKVDKTDGCWLWRGSLDASGYGQFRESKGVQHRSHRLSWEFVYGPIPPGLVCCHRCDVRNCVRPDHLFLGTVADNNADMRAKGRARNVRGEQQGQARLTESAVQEIRAVHVKRSKTNGALALSVRYGVCPKTILNVVKGRYWRPES